MALIMLTGSYVLVSVWSVLVIAVLGVGAGWQFWWMMIMELELVDGCWLVDVWLLMLGLTLVLVVEGVFDDVWVLALVMVWFTVYGEVW